jgi:hypothetical protein
MLRRLRTQTDTINTFMEAMDPVCVRMEAITLERLMSNTKWLYSMAAALLILGSTTGCPNAPDIAGSSTVTTVGGGGSGTSPTTGEEISWPVAQVDPLDEDTAGFNQVISADMNDDGLIDLVTAAYESQPIQLHLQQRSPAGEVSFDSFSVAGSGPIVKVSALRVADFDGDGNLDVIVASQDTGFAPFEECAAQECQIIILYAPDDARDALNWERYDLTFNHRCSLISDQPFTFATNGRDGNVMCYSSLDVGDVDGNGTPDVVAAFNGCDDPQVATKEVEVWYNPGGPDARVNEVLTGTEFTDIDFDGIADGCIATVDAPWTRALLQRDVVDIAGVRLSDVDLDDDLDVVAVRPRSKTFDVTWQSNPSRLDAQQAENWGGLQPIGESDTGIDIIEIGDLDGDGLEDVLTMTQGDKLLKWFRRPPDPAAQDFPWEVYNLVQYSDATPTAFDIADLDLNGQLDVVAAAGGLIRWFTPPDSPYDPWTEVFVANDVTSDVNSIHAVDIDEDGRLDITVTLDRPGVDDDVVVWLKNEKTEE